MEIQKAHQTRGMRLYFTMFEMQITNKNPITPSTSVLCENTFPAKYEKFSPQNKKQKI